MVVDEARDDVIDGFIRWRYRVKKALWDCFGMTAATFDRTYHGPELRRWYNDPARPQTSPAACAAVMIRFYTSRTWEAFPTPGEDARRWWEETLAGRDPAARNVPPVLVLARLHHDDEPGTIPASPEPPPMEL